MRGPGRGSILSATASPQGRGNGLMPADADGLALAYAGVRCSGSDRFPRGLMNSKDCLRTQRISGRRDVCGVRPEVLHEAMIPEAGLPPRPMVVIQT